MDVVLNHTRDGRPVLYPTVTPLDSSRQIDAYLRMTALGRSALQHRADAAGRPVPVVPAGMSRARRDELLAQSAAGRGLLAREAGR